MTMPKPQYLQFKSNMYKDIREDCWIEFECPFCHKGLWTESKIEYTKCECGEKFHVSAILYHVVDGE
jgi:hypothetical protein